MTNRIDALLEEHHLEVFRHKLAERVRFKGTIERADPETPYLFGLHPMAFIVPSVLALALMLKDALGAMI